MAEPAPASWNGFIHYDGKMKPRENSPQGIADAAVRTRKRIDLDSNMTKKKRKLVKFKIVLLRRTFANTHWGRLWIDEFIYTKASEVAAKKLGIRGVKAGNICHREVRKSEWELVSTLVSKHGHYPIHSMGAQVHLAASRRVDVEHETKDVPTVEEFKAIFATAADAYGPGWREHYIVKRIWTISGARQCLKNAHTADPLVKTLAIQVPKGSVDTLPYYVKYYRRG